jgi:hypothetical protein
MAAAAAAAESIRVKENNTYCYSREEERGERERGKGLPDGRLSYLLFLGTSLPRDFDIITQLCFCPNACK